MNYVIVQNGKIINIIDWDGVTPYTPPEDSELYAYEGPAGIGWAWVDGAPVDPNPPAPEVDPSTPVEGPLVL